MREKLEEPMHISDVMAEYLQELETTCNKHQATLNEGGFSNPTKGEWWTGNWTRWICSHQSVSTSSHSQRAQAVANTMRTSARTAEANHD